MEVKFTVYALLKCNAKHIYKVRTKIAFQRYQTQAAKFRTPDHSSWSYGKSCGAIFRAEMKPQGLQ